MALRKRVWQITQALALAASVVLFLLVAGSFYVLVVLAHDGRTPFNTSETRMIGVERYKADTP